MDLISYLACFAALALLLLKMTKEQRTKKTILLLLAASFAFELFIANFHSFHLIGGDYEEAPLSLNSDASLVSEPGTPLKLTYSSLDMPVGTVFFDIILSEGTHYADVRVDATDVTHAYSYRSNVADGRILPGNDRSAYLVLNLSGNVDYLRFTITPSTGGTVTLHGITLNKAVPLHFSALRLVLWVLGCLGVYFLTTAPCMKASYGECRQGLHRSAMGITALFVLAAIGIHYLSIYDQDGVWTTGFQNLRGDQITQEIVDAFRAGQVHLLDTPSPELLAMENPYDWSARQALGVYAKWDHLLYDGKYYSYYGIAPVLLLFLPYNLLTGFYFPTGEAILLFSVLGIVFLGLLFVEFAELFCKRIPNSILLSTLLVLYAACGVWYNLVYDNFYEIAQSSGFLFTCAGFFFLLRSRVVGEGKISYKYMVFATGCLSLAVLCRPTLALYCIVACIFLVFGFFKHCKAVQKGEAGKKTVKYFASALSCFVVIGGIQMLYNYARFGSVFDFGIQYSLTINDFTRSQYHTDFVMIGLYNFLFTFPKISPEFPYVSSNFSTLSTNGYYFVANRNAIGLFWRALPCFGYLGIGSAWKTLSKRERTELLCLLIPTCVLCPLIIIFSIWESGYGVRYCCDFAWQFILGGATVFYLIYARLAKGQGCSILRNAFTAAAVLALVVNGAMIYEYLTKTGFLTAAYLNFARIFDFWY